MPKSDTVTRQDIIDEVSKLRDTVDRWRVQAQAKLEKHEHVLYGNGNIGMDEQVRNINNQINLVAKLMWIVAGSIVTTSVGGVVYVVVYVIRASKP